MVNINYYAKRCEVAGENSVKIMLYISPSPMLHCIRLLDENIAGQSYWASQNYIDYISHVFLGRLKGKFTFALRVLEIFMNVIYGDDKVVVHYKYIRSLFGRFLYQIEIWYWITKAITYRVSWYMLLPPIIKACQFIIQLIMWFMY